MYRLLLFFIVQFYAIGLIAQKPVIDTATYGNWPYVTGAAISNNGRYAFYYIHNSPPGSHTLVLHAIGSNWKAEIQGAANATFTADSRRVVYLLPTLDSELVVHELPNGMSKSFVGVTNYVLSENGDQLAFFRHDTIWYYKTGMSEARMLANNPDSGLRLDSILSFRNSNTLLCTAKEDLAAKLSADAVQVDVWSYTDNKLQSRQLKDLATQRHTVAIGLEDHHLTRLASTVVDSSQSTVDDNMSHLKARDANVYIVQRTPAGGSPNYFYTTNFKDFTPLSNLRPEKDWNWFITESHTWQSLDNTTVNGTLYKPENFDSTKKYPLIFYCGDKMPEVAQPSDGRLNIPSFTSNGYLVFVPEIRLKTGAPGRSIYNTIISALNYLSKYSWVDTGKLGLQGFELGAYAANYMVTHTKHFAAVCSAAGLTDLISAYGSLDGNGDSQAPMIEGEPYRLGATLWDNPDLYIENSPIFDADKVTTPLLMMHNKSDDKVPFAQAIELFTGLRRLQKEAWLLQYDDGAHTLHGPSAVDFSVRMAQFFDHYLKGAPAPVWMTRGIPARMKGIVSGLELDR